jgi:hypothetical protein
MSSTLPEVYRRPSRELPEVCIPSDPETFPVAPSHEGLQVVDGQFSAPEGAPVAGKTSNDAGSKIPGTVLGFKRNVFIFIVILAAAIVVIAVLGGVLGSVLAARSQQSSSDNKYVHYSQDDSVPDGHNFELADD